MPLWAAFVPENSGSGAIDGDARGAIRCVTDPELIPVFDAALRSARSVATGVSASAIGGLEQGGQAMLAVHGADMRFRALQRQELLPPFFPDHEYSYPAP